MNAQSQELRILHLQHNVVRVVVLLLALVATLAAPAAAHSILLTSLLLGYLGLALLALAAPKAVGSLVWMDLVSAILTVVAMPNWFLVVLLAAFSAYAASLRFASRTSYLFAVAVAGAVLVRIFQELAAEPSVVRLGLAALLSPAAVLLAARLGQLQKSGAEEREFFFRIVSHLRYDRGLSESLRLAMNELTSAFACREVVLAFRDRELERIFYWRVPAGFSGRLQAESAPVTRSDAFLLDDLSTNLCWNSFEGRGEGFGWNRAGRTRLGDLPRLPGPSREALQARSLMAVAFAFEGGPVGRLLLINGKRKFRPADLRRAERVAQALELPLENLYRLRHLRTRAVEAERSRISLDLHDGVLQTLLGVEIQLGVLQRKITAAPEQAAAELGRVLETLRTGREELRRMVTDLRPLGVESADLVDLMRGYAERYRNETGIGLDLLIEDAGLELPDRICRELFQIYREALANVNKHASATHIVVKLSQNETKAYLVIDDNGKGFSFAGRFSSDELDRLRLGPISIKERTRSIGGLLTVESTPGHGARLTIEIPLN